MASMLTKKNGLKIYEKPIINKVKKLTRVNKAFCITIFSLLSYKTKFFRRELDLFCNLEYC